MSFIKWILFLLIGSHLILLSQQQVEEEEEEDDDNDECAFISGQHCNQNGICKYCAMCLQSSCILSKSINTNCNTTQFGTTNVYNWYDYCLSSENDQSGSYCATSTECYQYRKSVGPTITYAWNNLTCNPTSCMLSADDGAPPPAPIPPPTNNNDVNNTKLDIHHRTHRDRPTSPLHHPAAIALVVVCSLVLLVALIWFLCFGKKRGWFSKPSSSSSIASVPSTAPPSFSTIPPEMRQAVRLSSSSSQGSLPSYRSPYAYPPKYEQAIVTQIRGLFDDSASSSTTDHHMPSMWVPVYFTQQQGRRGPELFAYTPNSYLVHRGNPFEDEPS